MEFLEKTIRQLLEPRISTDPFPHVCGGYPYLFLQQDYWDDFSPRMWGLSYRNLKKRLRYGLFPTYVGVILSPDNIYSLHLTFPHVCGGYPLIDNEGDAVHFFSPRMWGLSVYKRFTQAIYRLFPTYVGVILYHEPGLGHVDSFPHVCGGYPENIKQQNFCLVFSPRMWGLSFLNRGRMNKKELFPTYVGVVPKFFRQNIDAINILCYNT